MTGHRAQTLFAALCILAMIAVLTGAILEMRRSRRGESLISLNQYRLRLLSAFIWVIVLGSLSYATLFLWPEPGDRAQGYRFLSVVSGAGLLFIIGIALLLVDIFQLSRERQRQADRFNTELAAMAEMEGERLRTEARQKAAPLDAPPKDSRAL